MDATKIEDLVVIKNFLTGGIYVMHYTKLTERKKMMLEQLDQTKLSEQIPVTWVEEFDRENITQDDLKIGYLHNPNILPRPMSLAEIANGFAHLHILDQVGEGDIILVLEDDTIFKENFIQNLTAIITELPSDWEFVCLGGPTVHVTCPAETLPGSTRLDVNPEMLKIHKPTSPGPCTASCFLVNYTGARKILDCGYARPLSVPIDELIWMAGRLLDIKMYWCQPWISYEGSKGGPFSTSLERGF